jgi:hypothetical protein
MLGREAVISKQALARGSQKCRAHLVAFHKAAAFRKAKRERLAARLAWNSLEFLGWKLRVQSSIVDGWQRCKEDVITWWFVALGAATLPLLAHTITNFALEVLKVRHSWYLLPDVCLFSIVFCTAALTEFLEPRNTRARWLRLLMSMFVFLNTLDVLGYAVSFGLGGVDEHDGRLLATYVLVAISSPILAFASVRYVRMTTT